MNHALVNDPDRLGTLRALHLLDTPAESFFDEIARFAAHLAGTPIATVTLIDEQRQWFKARVGLELPETPLAMAICLYTIMSSGIYVVEDTMKDPTHSSNPLVTGSPYLRAYAGVPLRMENGHVIGALAVMDTRPRRFRSSVLEGLVMLAQQVVMHITLRQQKLELELQTRRLREAQRIADIGSWELDLTTHTFQISEQVYRIYGVWHAEPQAPLIPLDRYLDYVHPDDLASVQRALEDARSGVRPMDIVHRIVLADGSVRHVRQHAELIRSLDQHLALAGTVHHVTELIEKQAKRELLEECIERVSDTVMITEASPLDEPGPRIVFVNKAFENTTGYRRDEVLGRSPRFLQGPGTQRCELDRVGNALRHCLPVQSELINYTKRGKPFWAQLDIAPVAVRSETPTHFVSVQRDVTRRKEDEHYIRQLAFYDALTGLPNRRLLMDRLAHALQIALRHAQSGAVMFIDLDNFKTLNDTMGHDKGDILLTLVAQRLQRFVRKSNTVARFGGDEFVILLEDLDPQSDMAATQARILGEKILGAFQVPFDVAGYRHSCTPSIGVALFNGEPVGPDEILKRADVAMYEAKASGRNGLRFFDKGMQCRVNKRAALDRDFRKALQAGEFVLHYQPQVDQSGQMIGVEALVRWRHPHRGLLYPSEFMWIAEDSNLIVELGDWVLGQACRQMALWQRRAGRPVPGISVNVSARQFHHPEFLPRTIDVLRAAGVDPRSLKLELTESTLVDRIDDTVAKMDTLKSWGVRFSLDDFGTGYSSLAYLKRLPIDEVKIDRSFIQDILCNQDDAAISQTIISLCQILGLNVMAEGIENESQRDLLAKQGCKYYQGYLMGRPVPPELL
ncbi:PAS domain S-box-containing protein/diguanylate cyclase (GGDEF) domain-containing protein [Noviherbaspirillum humi]|uniref:PAS domain S-box-containing protein/diguanylate cyclase (GGDEF) domain-containing protein n=1 Tax=Noviherbaspirillum humi TaxID=1688639 RepID=A0A239JTS7_9BURK|nr:EAL domain-containing protein [Noviherbaspirillum humi]SNT08284.1 PAS domain S-box-containing protein/diguanylate cyclase (GGDEF) domain-containing protein [Noviherbaspirillum humi]